MHQDESHSNNNRSGSSLQPACRFLNASCLQEGEHSVCLAGFLLGGEFNWCAAWFPLEYEQSLEPDWGFILVCIGAAMNLLAAGLMLPAMCRLSSKSTSSSKGTPASQWGSCNPAAQKSYSGRAPPLRMAPPSIMTAAQYKMASPSPFGQNQPVMMPPPPTSMHNPGFMHANPYAMALPSPSQQSLQGAAPSLGASMPNPCTIPAPVASQLNQSKIPDFGVSRPMQTSPSWQNHEVVLDFGIAPPLGLQYRQVYPQARQW